MGSALGARLLGFLKHYSLKRGYRDGWAGFVIALGNFEGTFYRYAKRYEEMQRWDPPPSEPLRKRAVAAIRRGVRPSNGTDIAPTNHLASDSCLPAHAPRRVAQHAERQREIVFAHDLPALAPARRTRMHAAHTSRCSRRGGSGDSRLPAGNGASLRLPTWSSSTISRGRQRPKSKPLQHFELVAFDIDREQIERRRRIRLLRMSSSVRAGTDDVSRARAPGAIRSRSSEDSGPATCNGSGRPALCGDEQATANTLARRAVPGTPRGRAAARPARRSSRAARDARSANCLLRMVGADLDEESGSRAARRIRAPAPAPSGSGAASHRRLQLGACGARDLCTIRVVL